MNPLDTARSVASDSIYVGIGFGVLVFQRLQVQRRDMEKAIARHRKDIERTLGRS